MMQKPRHSQKGGSCVALGNFDGVHIGHQAILSSCKKEAGERGLRSVVWSFEKHPAYRLNPSAFQAILTESQRLNLLKEMGIDEVVLGDFDELRGLSPEEFCQHILVEEMQAKAVFCGFNFTFGKGGLGTAQTMKAYLEPLGIEVFVTPPVHLNGEIVSSTLIRSALQEGNVEKANALLGRAFTLSLPTVRGKRLGSRMGFPTLNQVIPPHQIRPKNGVYAVMATIDGKPYPGICNVGYRPTVDSDNRVLAETHLLDFEGELYEKEIQVAFHTFLREERAFPSVEELQKKIEADCKTARLFWKERI